MAKRAVHIVLGLFIWTVTSGMTISQHYCGYELVSVSLNPESESCCDMQGCCHTESILVQFDAEYVLPGILKFHKQLIPEAPVLQAITFIFEPVDPHHPENYLIDPSPPGMEQGTRIALLQSMIL